MAQHSSKGLKQVGNELCGHPGEQRSRQNEQQVQRPWDRSVSGALEERQGVSLLRVDD